MTKVCADITMSLDGFITEPSRGATRRRSGCRSSWSPASDAIRCAAAHGRDVGVWGGGRLISGALRAGLLDEITIHLAPLLLGDGRRLFVDVDDRGIELERTRTVETANATHLTFGVTARG